MSQERGREQFSNGNRRIKRAGTGLAIGAASLFAAQEMLSTDTETAPHISHQQKQNDPSLESNRRQSSSLLHMKKPSETVQSAAPNEERLITDTATASNDDTDEMSDEYWKRKLQEVIQTWKEEAKKTIPPISTPDYVFPDSAANLTHGNIKILRREHDMTRDMLNHLDALDIRIHEIEEHTINMVYDALRHVPGYDVELEQKIVQLLSAGQADRDKSATIYDVGAMYRGNGVLVDNEIPGNVFYALKLIPILESYGVSSLEVVVGSTGEHFARLTPSPFNPYVVDIKVGVVTELYGLPACVLKKVQPVVAAEEVARVMNNFLIIRNQNLSDEETRIKITEMFQGYEK